jgi:hypothetical protein
MANGDLMGFFMGLAKKTERCHVTMGKMMINID